MLAFEMINKGRGIQIHCDGDGIATLVGALGKVERAGHLHLLARSNGGHELDETTPLGYQAIGEVIIIWAGD